MKIFKKRKKEPTIKLTKSEFYDACYNILLNTINDYESDYSQAIFYQVWVNEKVCDDKDFDELIKKCKKSYEKIKSETLFGDVLL